MRRHFLPVALLALCLAPVLAQGQAAAAPDSARTYDIVIAGAGTGGTSAAIQAARLGAHVALLEETDWIGGQAAAAAVSTMDEGNHLTPPSGFYREFVDRLGAYYTARGKSVSTCYWGSDTHCYEPSAVRKILMQTIDEVNAGGKGHIDLMLQDRVVRVLAHGNTVTGVVTATGRTLNSKVLIDATEYGDVLPLTPASFRSGHSIGADKLGSCTQDITYAMVIKKYPNGVPDELKMKNKPPEYDKWLPKLRASWRIDGNPVDRILPVDFAVHNAYRGLPDSSNPDPYVSAEAGQITRTALNWFNDFPTGTDIFDRSKRMQILCAAKLETLANLYYLQHDLNEPLWSVANDEGYDTAFNRKENSCPNIPAEFKAIEANFPSMPYIRESQRLIGQYTLTAGDIRRERQGAISVTGFADSIAVGDYADDLHACAQPSDLETNLEHLFDRPPGFRSGPFEVPLRSLIPEKVDGLLAAEKNISQSRLANGATRLQPITMLTGEAAGTLAALAVEKGVQPRAVPTEAVQIQLLKSACILAREPMPNLPIGMRPWQAAQFAVAHKWIDVGAGGFDAKATMTRAQAAVLLDRVFLRPGKASTDENSESMYGRSTEAKATYKDVPIYAVDSAAIEGWHASGTVPACAKGPEMFCPADAMTTAEFLEAVYALGGKEGVSVTKADLRREVHIGDADLLTRIDAVMILYNFEEARYE